MKAFTIENYFDEFVVGDLIEHSTAKIIFESDKNIFSLMTKNHHPVYTNADFAKNHQHQHQQLLVVGTLVFSLVVGMSVPDVSGKAIANLEYESAKHPDPVFINDTIDAKARILGKWETHSFKKEAQYT